MGVEKKAVGHIIFIVLTPMIAVLLSLVLLAILDVTNLLLILVTIGFTVISSNLIIYIALHGRSGISEAFDLKNIVYYVLYIGVSIITSYTIFFIAITCGTKYDGNPFAVSLAGGVITIIVFNTISLKKFLIKSKKSSKVIG